MTTVERVACKDAVVVFKLYMDFVLVTPAQKKYFVSKNCLSFTLEMYLRPHRLFFPPPDLGFGILQKKLSATTTVERGSLCKYEQCKKWWTGK